MSTEGDEQRLWMAFVGRCVDGARVRLLRRSGSRSLSAKDGVEPIPFLMER